MEKQKFRIRILLVVLLIAVSILAFGGCNSQKEEPADVQQLPDYTLYWNIDRDLYYSIDGAPVQNRKPEADGTYRVRLFSDGQTQEFSVADRKLVGEIDSAYLVPAVVDENGVITQILDMFDLPITVRAYNHYVYQIDGNVIQTNSSYRYDGTDYPLTIEEYTKVYDMTGTSGPAGTATKLVEDDRIIAVEDAEGRLTNVFVYVRMGTSTRIKRVCEHCKEEVVWTHWYKDDSVPVTNGHFYLTTDVQLASQGSIKLDQKICLDLNGHTIRGGENKRIYSCHYANVELAIMDYSQEKTGKLVAWGDEGAQGGCVWIRYGKFSLYAGTLDGSEYTSVVNGATVSVPKNAQFDMYGGTIIGGTATPTVNKETGKVSYGMGGAVYVGGTFNMYDGTIRDGYAKSAYDRTTGKYAVGYGGNVMVAGGEFNMHNGIISHGRADGGGGNLYAVSGGTFNLYGGVIRDGFSLRKNTNGGNVTIATKSKMRMEGGSICFGVATLYGGNLRVDGTIDMIAGQIYGGKIYDVNTGELKEFDHSENVYFPRGNFNMYGGWIHGGFLVQDAAKDDQQPALFLTGTAKIYGATDGRSNLKIATSNDGAITKVGTLKGSAKISTTASGLFTEKTEQANQKYFLSDHPDLKVEYYDQRLLVGRVACLCGQQVHIGKCDGQPIVWGACVSDTWLPAVSGYFYLVEDVTLTKQFSVPEGVELALDLNGHSITCAGRVIGMNKAATLTITDSVGTGSVAAVTDTQDNGMVLNINHADAVLNLYGGTLDGSGVTNGNNGAAVNIAGSMYMYGGKVIGATAAEGANGGAVRISNTDAKLELCGGTILGGKADRGGAIFNNGTLLVSGGAITGGTADNGGAIYNTGKIEITGGTITGGTVGGQGSAIYSGNEVKMSGGTIIRGEYLKAAVVYQKGENALFEITGGVLDGMVAGSSAQMGAITAWTGSTVTVNGGTIQGNPKSMYAYGATVNIQSGTVTGNQLYISGDTTAKLPSTINVTGGSIPKEIYLRYGSANISGNPVMNGLNFYDEAQKVTVGTLTEDADLPVKAMKYQNKVHPNYTLTDAGSLAYMHEATNTYELSWVEGEGLYIGKTQDDTENKPEEEPAETRMACAVCAGAYEKCEHTQMVEYTGISSLPTKRGYYYLTEKVVLENQWTVPEGTNIVLDLNGKTIESTKRAIALNKAATLTITDSVGTGSVVVVTDTKDNGMVLNINHAEAVLNLYGGTLDGTGVTNGNNGAAVNIAGTMHMYGGTVIGATAAEGANGGAVRISNANAKLELWGGTILGGKADRGGAIFNNGTLLVSGGAITGGIADNGGAIYNTGKIEITGGTITGGTVGGQGSAIYSGNEVKMSGGTIIRGEYLKAAVVYQKGENALFEITGGVLDGMVAGSSAQMGAITAWTGSTVTVNGGTIQGNPKSVYAYGATVNIQSGTVTGNQLYISGDTTAKLPSTINVTGGSIPKEIYLRYGSANISGNPVMNGLNFYDEAQKVTVGTLTEGADLPVKAMNYQNQVHPNYTLTDAGSLAYMHEATNTYELFWFEDQGLCIGKVAGVWKACAVCAGVYEDCEHTQLVEYVATSTLPTKSGYYYLTGDVTLQGQWSVPEGANIVLDLNGKTVESTKRAIALNKAATLTITDSVGTGVIAAKTETKDNGMVLNVNNTGATVIMYAGTLDGSGVTNGNNGVAVNVAGTFKLYDGVIIGGRGATGGCIRVNNAKAIFEMYGGSVYGGKTSGLGHNLYIKSCDYTLLAGGQIAGGAYYEGGVLKLEGDIVIDNALTTQFGEELYVPTYSLKMPTTKTAQVSGDLTAEARIVMSLAGSSLVVHNVADQTQCERFFLTDTQCERTYDPEAKTLTLTAKE